MRGFRWIVFSCFVLASASMARAGILEVRAGGGLAFVSPNDFDKGFGALSSGLTMDDLKVINADVFVNVPALPFGAGVRYETSQQDQRAESGGAFVEWDLDLGTELGYQVLKYKKPDPNVLDAEIDLSGLYGKVMVGYAFF
jgi:hypothetical protein